MAITGVASAILFTLYKRVRNQRTQLISNYLPPTEQHPQARVHLDPHLLAPCIFGPCLSHPGSTVDVVPRGVVPVNKITQLRDYPIESHPLSLTSAKERGDLTSKLSICHST
jgi:hypothetical protein